MPARFYELVGYHAIGLDGTAGPPALTFPERSSQVSVEDTVHGMWKALSARDWDAVKSYLSDDCIYLDVPVSPAAAARARKHRQAAQDRPRAAGIL